MEKNDMYYDIMYNNLNEHQPCIDDNFIINALINIYYKFRFTRKNIVMK